MDIVKETEGEYFLKKYRWILIIAIVVFFALIFLFFSLKFRCGDGTFHGGCSEYKPYFCNDNLVEKASVCGCPENFKIEGEKCVSEYFTNPKKINLTYDVNGDEGVITFTAYGGVANYLSGVSRQINSYGNDTPSRRDFKMKNIDNEIQREALLPLVVEIQNLAWSKKEQAKIAINLVQNIPYGESEKKINFYGTEMNYSRYAYEVLYENEGVCGERAELLAFLLREISYGVSIFYYPAENHEGVGVKCFSEETGYCYIETTTSLNVEIFSEPEIIPISDGKSFKLF